MCDTGSVARRVALVLAGIVALWLVISVVLGVALGGRTGDRVAARLGESLQAKATVGDASLTVLRGRLELERLAVRREDGIGTLALDVANVRCELLPLGLALFDRTCSEIAVRGVRLEVSALALFKFQRPKRKPFHTDAVIVDDAVFAFSPSALVPGLGRVEIKLEHAEAGPTTFKTPLSFLFALRELRAVFELPAGLTMRLTYKGGVLRASGAFFGSQPIELPIALPVKDAADDAQGEMAKLVAWGRGLGEQLVAARAKSWLKTKLR